MSQELAKMSGVVRSRRVSGLRLFLALSASLTWGGALAQDVSLYPVPQNDHPAAPDSDQPSIAPTLPGLRDIKQGLLDRGVNFQLNYIADAWDNPVGGVKQGASFQSILEMVAYADLGTIAGLNGLTFRINAYEINGRGLSTYNIFNLATIDSIEARATARLYEVWFEQKLFGDLATIRIGQLVADNQFFISDLAGLYVNSSFGYPTITAADQPSGGPAYPLATPGIRLKVTPNEHLALLAAIYNGDPSGAGFTGLQEYKDPSGLNFRIQDPPLVFGEVQYSYNQEKTSQGLAGTIKIGSWYHFGNFPDELYSFRGKSLADPTAGADALMHSGNFGVYGIMDQMLWRAPGDDPKKGVGAFGRVSFSPPDRNLVDFYADAGVNFMGVFEQRPDDSFGVAASFTRLSPSVRDFDRDGSFFNGEPLPVRNYELVVEATYQAQIIPGWTVQPDFQYVFHPGGGTIDPLNPEIGRIPDAAVFGLRTMIRY